MRGKPVLIEGGGSPVGLIPARAGKTCRAPSAPSSSRAHPRACGENATNAAMCRTPSGSSPRVRGKPRRVRPLQRRRRLIPARAGKTGRTTTACRTASAHPRACGENDPPAPGLISVAGSSPRVRGKPARCPRLGRGSGLIPARAGKTGGRRPRWRWARGSSPRVRGKLRREPRQHRARRLIPARAGKTTNEVQATGPSAAHPRACGENLDADLEAVSPQGSSPRVRGKRTVFQVVDSVHGLIPARAGKTWAVGLVDMIMPAHPRACGENVRDGHGARPVAGSSPRVRGKLRPGARRLRALGLIPARAGKTLTDARRRGSSRAHPRACGEN